MKHTNHKRTKRNWRFSRENLKMLAMKSFKAELVIAFLFIQGCATTNHSWNTTMWNDNLNQLQTFSLDMTEGTCITDGEVVYLWVKDKYSNEKVMVAVPIGDWVISDGPGQIPVFRRKYTPAGKKL